MQRVLRDTTTWLGIFLELNAEGSDVLFGTGAICTCSGMFRTVLKTAWVIQWLVLVLGQKFTLLRLVGERAEV